MAAFHGEKHELEGSHRFPVGMNGNGDQGVCCRTPHLGSLGAPWDRGPGGAGWPWPSVAEGYTLP